MTAARSGRPRAAVMAARSGRRPWGNGVVRYRASPLSACPRSARPGRTGRPAAGLGPTGHRSAGQSTVELALLLPILAMVLLVVIQVARVASDQVAVHHAVREAARLTAVEPDRALVRQRAVRAAPELRPERIDVEIGPQRSPGSLIEVRVRYRSPTEVPVVGRFVGDVELTATAVVRLE